MEKTSAFRSRFRWALPSAGEIVFILFVSGLVLVERGRTMRDPFFLLPLSLFSAVLVGPILTGTLRRNPGQSAADLLKRAVSRAVATILLIVILSLVLVNLLSWNGEVTLPTAETVFWAALLSITAALAVAAWLILLLPKLSPNGMKWGFRVVALAGILFYQKFPVAWSISWHGLVSDWGISWMAFAWEALLASSAAAAFAIGRSEVFSTSHCP